MLIIIKRRNAMLKKLTAIILIAVSMSLLPAEKYAVLITGDYAATPGGDKSNPLNEFWNDTFLMWEMLVTKMDYKPENVYVLFADGVDYWKVPGSNIHERYTPQHYDDKPGFEFIDEYYQITENAYNDGAATLGNLQQLTGELKDKLNEEDFLFVWTFDHGGRYEIIDGSITKRGSYLQLIDQQITDFDFANLFNHIPAFKKVYWMQQCYGGGFEYELTHDMESAILPRPVLPNVFFNSATQFDEPASRADNRIKNRDEVAIENNKVNNDEIYKLTDADDENQPPVQECEIYNEKFYTHGEFNYLMYSASMGHNPNFEEYYYKDLVFDGIEYPDIKFSIADGIVLEDTDHLGNMFTTNSFFKDGILTISEISGFEKNMESITYEKAYFKDYSNIGVHTSLKYPTIIFDEFFNPDVNARDYELKGIIGTAKNAWVYENDSYNIGANSNLIIAENSDVWFETSLNVGDKSEIIGEGLNSKLQAYKFNTENCVVKNTLCTVIERMSIARDAVFELSSGSSLSIMEGSTLWLDYGAILQIDAGAVCELNGPMTVVMCPGSKIIENGELIVNNTVNWTTNVLVPDPDKIAEDGPWHGIIAGVGSKISITGSTFNGAECAISGTPASLSVTNCTFTDCTNGINIVGCNNYTIENNTFTGTDTGTGISITSSDGTFSRNVITHFNLGAYFVMSSPVVSKCEISYNKYFGIIASGHDAIPQLINTEDNQPFGAVNCTIQKNAYVNNSSLFPSAQIGINPTGSIYMRFNDIISSPNFYGISIAQEDIRDPNQFITIDAILNYWGTEDVTDDYFFEHPQYIIKYDPTWSLADEYNSSFNSYITEESRILTNAISLETEDKLTPAIKLYEHIIKKYVDTPEYYVAMTRLPYLYEQAELDNNVLISMYDEALNSDATSHKKFFKGKKVATHIKGRRYDDAIAVAEEMKAEADFEEEVVLTEINIALATLLKEAEGKGNRSVDNSAYLQELLKKLYGTEKYETPSDISENALPSESKLHQNYPNPFNPVTQIKYDLAKASDVKLNVYNISGQKVAELASGVMNAGSHSVEFDGSRLNSGVYYYTLETDGVSMTKKLILMK